MPSPAQIKARKAFVKKYAGKKKGSKSKKKKSKSKALRKDVVFGGKGEKALRKRIDAQIKETAEIARELEKLSGEKSPEYSTY